MITLERDGKRMEVATELQASAFMKHGYKKVEKETPKEDVPSGEPVYVQKPKRRRKAAAEPKAEEQVQDL